MRSQLLTLSCALLGGLWLQRVTASCYYPDGKPPDDYNYDECSNTAGSSCCKMEDGQQCLSNGLCYDAPMQQFYRGGCSDQSWKSDGCFQHCKGNSSDSFSSYSSYDTLVSCGNNKYCCSSEGSTCCNEDANVFEVTSASVIKDLSVSTTYSGPSFAPTATETATSGSGAKSSNPTGTAASATATSSPSSSSQGVSKTAVIAGAVAGVIILLIAIFLVFFCVRRRYRKKLAEGTNPQSFPMSSDGFQKLPANQNQQQMPDKSPRPAECYTPVHPPAPPAYAPPQNGAVEIDNSYRVPPTNQWGQPIYEAPAQPYRG